MSDVRLPSIEFALGIEYSECSVAAATCNYIAREHIQNEANVSARTLYYADPDATRPYLQDFDFVPLSSEVLLKDNRPVVAGLVRRKPTDSPELVVISRGNIAFPVASFRRGEGERCAYVQIGDEMRGGESIVTQNDEKNRRKTIDLIRDVLEVDVGAIQHAEAFKEIDENERAALEKSLRKNYRLSGGQYSSPYGDQAQYVLLEEAGYISHPWVRVEKLASYIEHTAKKFNRQLTLPLEKVGKRFPNSDNPVIKSLLLRKVLGQRGVQTDCIEKANGAVLDLLQDTDIDEEIEARLGAYDKRAEAITSYIGELAAKGETLGIVVDEFPLSNNTTLAEISISARNSGIVGSNMLDVETELIAMDKGMPVRQSYNVDSLGHNPLSDAQLQEVADLINVVTGEEFPKNLPVFIRTSSVIYRQPPIMNRAPLSKETQLLPESKY